MSTTILKALGNELYTEGKGVGHFYPFQNENDPTSWGSGIRIGDTDALTVTVELTDGETRFSNEYATKTAVLTPVSEISCKLDMTVAQLTETAIQAVLMGKKAPFTQTAQANLTKTLAAGEIAFLGGFDAQITDTVNTETMAPALPGVDYLFDGASSQIQAMSAIEITYSIPEVSDRFKIGVASGKMPRGMFIFRGVAQQGIRRILRLHDVQLKPSGGLDLISDGILTPTITGTCSPISGQDDGFAIGMVTEVPA